MSRPEWTHHAGGLVRPFILAGVAAAALCMAAPALAQVSRVSVTATDAEANGASFAPAASADGRIIAFLSDATNLVANDTNDATDLFVKDRQTGTVTRVNVTAGGDSMPGLVERPGLSADGRFVIFTTTAALVPEDTNSCPAPEACRDVYLFDRTTSQPRRVSVATDGSQGNGASSDGRISGDGRFIVFRSAATTFAPMADSAGTDLYIHDLLTATTTRLPVAGAARFAPASAVAIAHDGQTIAFSADAALFDDRPRCHLTDCRGQELFVHTRQDGRTVRLDPRIEVPGFPRSTSPRPPLEYDMLVRNLSSDGRFLTFVVRTTSPVRLESAVMYDLLAERIVRLEAGAPEVYDVVVSGDGRWLAACQVSVPVPDDMTLHLFDTRLMRDTTLQLGTPARSPRCDGLALSADGLQVFFASGDSSLVPGDANDRRDIFAFQADADGDGMPSEWETYFGLDPANPGDGLQDVDDDAVSNVDEYRAATHPRGVIKRYFAEGATNGFFQTQLDVFNPGTAAANVLITYLGANGRTSSQLITMAPNQHNVITPFLPTAEETIEASLPHPTFSTVIESTALVVAERTMTWNGFAVPGPYGSHAETAIVEPRTEWYFAEGSTGLYSLYYLLQNPNSSPATVEVTYWRPARVPFTVPYVLPPHSRRTIDVAGEPGMEGLAIEVSARVRSDVPILAERAMYLSTPGELYSAGHAGSAIPGPATEWFIAEGATGFFSLYYLVLNPNTVDIDIVVTYLFPDGTTLDSPRTIAPLQRLTVDVNNDFPRLQNTEVSAIVRSVTPAAPIIVERVMYWPRGNPYEATLTAGTTETGRRWAFASAEYARSPVQVDSYLLVANPSDQSGTFTVKQTAAAYPLPVVCERTFPIAARSRRTVHVAEVCEGVQVQWEGLFHFAGTVETNGPSVVAERATYQTYPGGQIWTTGAAAAMTKLPDVP